MLPALFAAAAMPLGACAATAPAYSVTTSIAAPDGSWDYAQADDAGKRVFVARGNSVTVIDVASGAVSSMGPVQRGHEVVPLPGGKLLVTSGTDGTVRLFDLATGTQTASIAVGKKPDAAILDDAKTHAYVMNAASGTVSVIDLTTATVTRTITVKPALEYAAFAADGMLYINNEDANEIETVDVAAGVAGKPIALPGCTSPSGLAYDKPGNRLISACANGKAAIVDVGKRALAALIDIGIGPDAVILDAPRGLAFIPCGRDGVLDILSLSGASVTHVGTVKTEPGARTGAIDPVTGTLYLPTAKFGPPATPAGRPAMIPGSFHIVVVRRS
ncbi:YncE family protein [Novosphingobium sp.]|uniref:YncE family protein n=1 Tax=Novosphingobium sp. TaxID=1874826 RepID=UPI00333FDE83